MRILAVYPYVPWPLNRGAYHRAFHLLKGLAKDHEIDLLALAENNEGAEHADQFDFCGQVRVIPFQHPPWQKFFPGRLFNSLPSTVAHWTVPSVAEEIRRSVSSGNYDAAHVLDLVLSQFFIRENKSIPLVLDRTRVDLQYQLMEQKRMTFSIKAGILNYENLAKLLVFEKTVARRCALQVVCGVDDKAFVHKYVSRSVPISVIPNGVDLEYFHPSAVNEPRDPDPTIIFCGAMDYNPNVDALRWFFSEIHQRLLARVSKLKVLIVGKDPGDEIKSYGNRPGVTVTGGVPDVRPYYKRAWLQIVPLRIGGGTRLKIVESLGIGTPVVSTRIGAQGLDLREGHDILYAETTDQFVEKTGEALEDETVRASLGKQGRGTVAARLSWNKLGADLSREYQEKFRERASLIPGDALAGVSFG
jgi:polysaccharide biosynthesis protein PslH